MPEKFAIGIPTLNRADLLNKALEQYAQTFPDIDIYILDNGKQTGINMNTGCIIRYYAMPEPLSVAASWNYLCNKIFEHHKYAIILNDDIIIDFTQNIIQEMLDKYEEHRIKGAICARQGFCAFVLPKDVYLETGPFDEEFAPAYFEDNDYIYRLKIKGFKVATNTCLQLKVWLNSQTIAKEPGLNKRFEINKRRYIQKWGGMPVSERFASPFNRIGVPGVKKRLLWISEFRAPTGFARVSEALVAQLAGIYDITVFDILKYIQGNYTVTDKAGDHTINIVASTGPSDPYGVRRAADIMDDYDIIFILNDIHNINLYLKEFKKSGKYIPKIVIYFPVDMTEHSPEWYANLDIVSEAVTYTKFGYDVAMEAYEGALKAGGDTKIKVTHFDIVPHGIDTATFFKMDLSKAQIRQMAFGTDKYKDTLIFFNGNRNQPRKRLDITMAAFRDFVHSEVQKGPLKGSARKDVALCMHCGNVDGHINIRELAKRWDIEEYMIFSKTEVGLTLLKDSQLNVLYNACDVGINTSFGEGWSLITREHGATGALQIVPCHSAFKELSENEVVFLPPTMDYIVDNIMTVGKLVDSSELTHVMALIRKKEAKFGEIAEAGRIKFTDNKFSWQAIAGMWTEIFDKL